MATFKEVVKKPVFIVAVVLGVALIVALSIVLVNVKSLKRRQQRQQHKQQQHLASSPSSALPFWGIKGTGRKVVMISVDGLRFDMLSTHLTPNLVAMGRNGSMLPLEPQFPSLTFPNHYTLVTGLLPAEHGIIGNRFMNWRTGKHFSVNEGTFKDPTWWKADPIWTQADSAVCMWPGSEVPINGKRPGRWVPYHKELKGIARMDTLLDWIESDAKNKTSTSRLYMSYFSALDEQSHGTGPDSKEAQDALQKIDSAIGHLWEGLKVRNMTDVDVLIVSDHGITTVPKANRISMHRLLPGYSQHLRFWECGAVTHILPQKQDVPAVLSRLRRLAGQGAPFRVYTRDTLPPRWHLLTNHTRNTLPPIFVVAKAGHAIDCVDFHKRNSTMEQNDVKPRDIIGVHGYDFREEPDMLAALIAVGPHVKKTSEQDSFSNLDVYNLASRLLQIQPAPNNGTMRLSDAILI